MPDPSVHTDTALLGRIAHGDHAAFTELFNQYWDAIYGVALALTKSETMAEDAVQEVFSKVWGKRTELTSVGRMDNYLFVLARNHIFSEFKKLKVRKEHVLRLQNYFADAAVTPEDALLRKESGHLIEQAVQRLAAQQQHVYRLSREQGLTQETIAAQLGISVHTVRNHMVRATKHIRAFLQQQDANTMVLFAFFKTFL